MSVDLAFRGCCEGQPRNAVSPDLHVETVSSAGDLYDRVTLIPRDKLTAFFQRSFALSSVPATSPSSDFAKPGELHPPASWSGVLAMSLCVFALIASEFMPVSLLTPIATDLNVTEGMAGQGIAMSGAFAVITSLSISALSRGMNRKSLLLWMTVVMCVSGAIVALAQSFAAYLFGRALIGMVIGGFWSMSVATAMRLVPPAQVPRALAIFNGGNALATIIAAPLGSYLGAIFGWRGAFFCLVPVGLLALAWQWISLPSMPARAAQAGSANVFRLLRRRAVSLGMLAVGLFFMGQFMLFTYLRPFLESVTKVDVSTLSLVLLAIGLAGFAGTSAIGSVLKFGLYRTLFAIPLLMAAIAVALIGVGEWTGPVAALLALWGFAGTAAPVGWWSWLAKTLPDDAEAGGGLLVAIVQLSIALGSTAGGVLYDGIGYRATFLASAVLLAVAAALTLLTARAARADAGTRQLCASRRASLKPSRSADLNQGNPP